MEYLRLGNAMNPSLATVTPEDACRLTHLNLAFGLIREGVLDLRLLPDIDRIHLFRQWNPRLKIVLSVGGWGAGGFSGMAMTEEGRCRFAGSCLAAVEQYRLDGIDIDWEYPCDGIAGIDADSRDRENFTLLLKALRRVLGKDRILSVAMGASEDCIRNTQMDRVVPFLDYVQLMTYDMTGGFSGRAGHHAALGPSRGDSSANHARAVVELYRRAGVPYEKMVLGAAFYSRAFEVHTDQNRGILQPSGPGLPGPTFAQITEDYCAEHGYEVFWDEQAEAAWLWNGKTFVSFESEEAIRRKCRFVKEKGLLGLMYWEHGNDPTRTLLGIIADSLT